MEIEADEASCPRHAADVVAKTIDEVAVLLNLTNEMYYSLNEVGARVWELADGQRSIAAIVDAVAAEYDADRNQIRDDVQSLLAELAAEGLVSWDAS